MEATNLANNHSHDYGDQSYEDTIQYLEAAGITTFGYDRTAVMDVKGIKVGLIGIYELKDGIGRQQQVIDTIQEVKNQGVPALRSSVPDGGSVHPEWILKSAVYFHTVQGVPGPVSMLLHLRVPPVRFLL